MKKLFLTEFDTRDKNATADNVEKNAAETAEKEKNTDYNDNTDTWGYIFKL
jgi:hypothetical protein